MFISRISSQSYWSRDRGNEAGREKKKQEEEGNQQGNKVEVDVGPLPFAPPPCSLPPTSSWFPSHPAHSPRGWITGSGALPEIHSVDPSIKFGGVPDASSILLQLHVANLKRSLMQPGWMRPPKSSEPYWANGPVLVLEKRKGGRGKERRC